MCCEETRYCFHLELHEGKIETDFQAEGLGASVILKNISQVSNPSNHIFYVDNFFISHTLMKYLEGKNVRATGTVRYNRTNKCPFKSDDLMKKESRGTYDVRCDEENNIFAAVWKDSNVVKALSNRQGIEPTIRKESGSFRAEKKNITLPQFICICNYNKYIGGVDQMDWMVNKYRIKIKLKKWYFPICTNLINMTVVNGHVLYEMVNGKIPLREFRRILARAYLPMSSISDPKLCGRPHLRQLSTKCVPDDIRKSHVGHFTERTEDGRQRKCTVCKKMRESDAENAM